MPREVHGPGGTTFEPDEPTCDCEEVQDEASACYDEEAEVPAPCVVGTVGNRRIVRAVTGPGYFVKWEASGETRRIGPTDINKAFALAASAQATIRVSGANWKAFRQIWRDLGDMRFVR